MEFLEKNWKAISFGTGAVIILGLVYVLISNQSQAKEKLAQESFSVLQDQFNKMKEQQSAGEKNEAAKPMVDKARLKVDLEEFISKSAGTVASQVAAIYMSDILVAEKKLEESIGLLKKVESKSTVLSNTLVLKTLGQILADSDQCKEAISTWDKILVNKKAEFLFADIQIKQALCYQKLNEEQKAVDILNKIKSNKSEGYEQSSLEAERILRLIQFNKVSGT
jgi:tetratricopeptide (TPR) repeat protein